MKSASVPIIDSRRTGNNIKKLRKRAGFSVREMQKIFGFGTPQAIYKWQRGATIPSIDNLIVLGELFDLTIEDILVIRRCKG